MAVSKQEASATLTPIDYRSKRPNSAPSFYYASIERTVDRPEFPQALIGAGLAEPLLLRKIGQVVVDPDENEVGHHLSPIDGFNKYTEKMVSCVGVLVTGESVAKDAPSVSQLFHINPFISYNPVFLMKYTLALFKIVLATSVDNRSVTVVGGLFHDQMACFLNLDPAFLKVSYQRFIRTLDLLHFLMLKTRSQILDPKTYYGRTNLYYDNWYQRAYVVETGQMDRVTPKFYQARDLKTVSLEWEAKYKPLSPGQRSTH